jgi:CRP/FNR family transcriptional regulator
MNNYWFIPPSDFLNNMDNRERESLMSLSASHVYKKGEYIFQTGDPGRNVYILEDGRAKICQLSASGKEMILWFCLPGEIFGLAELPRGGIREVFAQACTEAQVHSISREDFKRFLHAHPDAAMQIIDLLSCRMRVLGHMLLNLASDDVTSRIIKLILRLSARYMRDQGSGICLDFPLTHQEIADMIGASRQTVTSALSELKKEGILSVEQHCIHIRNPARLEDRINQSASFNEDGLH